METNEIEKECALAEQNKHKDTNGSLQAFADVIHPENSKDVDGQSEDVIIIQSAKNAFNDKIFMNRVTTLFERKVITQQEADSMKRDRLVSEQYYIKWMDILNLAGIKTPQGLGLMRLVVIIMMIPYLTIRLIDFFFQTISTVITFFNRICNAVFGQKKKVQLDENGNEIAAEYGFNIIAKIFVGLIIASIFTMILLVIIKYFTGFDLIAMIRTGIKK